MPAKKILDKPLIITNKNSMMFVRTLVEEKTGLRIDQPDTRGGTTSTGSIARRAFSYESSYIDCVLSVVGTEHKETLSKLPTQLSAILRIINPDRIIDTEEFGDLCTNTYLMIVDTYIAQGISSLRRNFERVQPWA